MKDFFISYTGADAKIAEWIAWILEDKQPDTALSRLNEIQVHDETTLDEISKRLPQVYYNKGLAWFEKVKYDSARGYFEKVDSMQPGNSEWLNWLGRTFDALGQYDQAIAAYRKALAIDTVVYGKNHSEVAICYNNIGMAWKAKGDYKKAEASLHRAIESAKAFWPETHSSMKTLRRNLAEIIPVEKK